VLSVFVFLHSLVVRIRPRDDEGQTTAEYALVLLGAATVALVVVTWATRSGKITALLDGVIDQILSKL
jgi:Flp pilus assembly pilin Flp